MNIKITNAKGRANKNDIAAVEKLYMQYATNSEYRLTYAVFGFTFQKHPDILCQRFSSCF